MPRKRKLEVEEVDEGRKEGIGMKTRKRAKRDAEEKRIAEPKKLKTDQTRTAPSKKEIPKGTKSVRIRKEAVEGKGLTRVKKRDIKKVVKQPTPQPSSSSESEWEDVADHVIATAAASDAGGASTSKSIQITVNAPKTQKELDAEGEIRRAIKRFRKELQENLHKAHLLTLIAHGRWLSSVCNDELNKAISLSLVPSGYTEIGKDSKFGKDQLKRFVRWFRSGFICADSDEADDTSTSLNLVLDIRTCLQSRTASNGKILSLCFVTSIRALGLDCRIVFNAHPITRKVRTTMNEDTSKKDTRPSTRPRTKATPVIKKSDDKSTQRCSSVQQSQNGRISRQSGRKEETVPKRTRSTGSCEGKSNADTADAPIKGPKSKKIVKMESRSRSSEEEQDHALKDADREGRIDDEYWAEVYLESMEQWLSVDCVRGVVDDVEVSGEAATSPITYCLAFDKDLALKDVTSRYSKDFMSSRTRGLRAPGEWLTKTFALFGSKKRLRNRLEDMQLEDRLNKQSLPTSVGEFKNHPLYVLKKDLKKFEGIYPLDTKPIGFFRDEPVYRRSAVHMLHSKDQWRKEALVVKENEEPYKVVKGRPKWNAATQEKVDDREVPLFGRWQTEPYKPKAAKDGMVPRNEYGNVELFKMSMLPPGTVYLELPGLLNVARKMDIDCAPAMVGWEFHGRSSHPVLNGWVVCEEYKDVLMAAWEEEQEIIKQREQERRSKRALQNWRRLLKALLIRRKLQRKFRTSTSHTDGTNWVSRQRDIDTSEEKDENSAAATEASGTSSVTHGSNKEGDLAARTSRAWPQCRRDFTGNRDEEL